MKIGTKCDKFCLIKKANSSFSFNSDDPVH